MYMYMLVNNCNEVMAIWKTRTLRACKQILFTHQHGALYHITFTQMERTHQGTHAHDQISPCA